MRQQGRRDKFTQCRRRSINLDDINRLTINAIRNELRAFGDSTDGSKIDLAERLRLRRIRNDELAEWFANDSDGSDGECAFGSGIKNPTTAAAKSGV